MSFDAAGVTTDPTSASADALARDLALDPERSIALQAPAGSGKTTVLVQRFLRLLATVDEPEQILAITFTRKAAGEMRERVVRAVRGEDTGGDDQQPDARHRERVRALARAVRERSARLGWALEANPGRLRIQTIDALNRSIAARLPLAARGAGEMAVSDHPWELYRLAARRALLDSESEPVLQPDTELLFARLDNDFGRFERLLAEMLRARAHWLPRLLRGDDEHGADLGRRVEASLHAIVAERLNEARALIPGEVLEQGMRVAERVARNREQSGHSRPGPWLVFLRPSRIDALTLRHWQGLAHLALTHQGVWRRSLSLREGFPAEDRALKEEALRWLSLLSSVRGARELLVELVRLPQPELSREDAGALASLSRLLPLAASELEVVFRERGRLDHTAVAAAAREALMSEGAPTDLALRLGTDTRHILVDEYQDTSIEQLELLEALTATWEEGDGRTLFVVGDPMQSIYQFREAEVGLFLQAAVSGIGGLHLRPLALTRNFRSASELTAWTNRIFPECFPPRDDPRTSAVRYRPSIASRSDARGIVRWHVAPRGDPRAEARAVTGLIARLRADHPEARIAILLTSRSHAPPIVAALGAAQIAVAGVDLVSLGDLAIVRDLQALARALHHLGDRTAWLAVLRAPWCGLTLSELSLLAERARSRTVWESLNDEATLQGLPPDARARLDRARAVLAEALEQRERMEPAAWVEAAWLGLGGPAACAEDSDLDRARAFFAHLARWAADPEWTGPLSLGERLEELYASHEAPARAVQIMTIHRAKGLEFDYVVLPGLGRKLRASPEPLLRWLELPRDAQGTDLLVAPIPAPGRRGSEPLTEYLKSLQARRAAHERVRLIYVAATRARDELHLFADLPPSQRPQPGTLLAALWPAAGAELLREPLLAPPENRPGENRPLETESSGNALPESASPAQLARLPANWQLPPFPAAPSVRGLIEYSEEPVSLDDQNLIDEGAHLLLPERGAERAVCDQLRRCSRHGRLPGAEDWIERALRDRLVRLGFEGAELAEEVRRAVSLWERCVGDSQLRWIFSERHVRAESPLELSGLYQGRLMALTVDRAFADERGVRWLVNFRPESARATHGVAQRVQAELEKAIALAKELGAQEVRAGVYFPSLQAFREVPQS